MLIEARRGADGESLLKRFERIEGGFDGVGFVEFDLKHL